MNIVKRTVLALVATATLGAGALVASGPAAAHNWQNTHTAPVHTHQGSCAYNGIGTVPQVWYSNTCVRYILANGAVIQAPFSTMQAQYGYVLLWCSFATTAGNPTRWYPHVGPYGPWGNTFAHPYCQSPEYYSVAAGWQEWNLTYP